MIGIIDSHTHMGSYDYWDIRKESLKALMLANNITTGIISDISGKSRGALSWYDGSNRLAAERGNRAPVRLYPLLWCNPKVNDDLNVAIEILSFYHSEVFGIKLHPNSTGLRIDDKSFLSYIELADHYNIPVAVHTELNGLSDLWFLSAWANKFPNTSFVAIHSDYGSDHKEAFKLISGIPNLYGDTSLMRPAEVFRAIDTCGADKILYGSDAMILEEDSYMDLETIRIGVSDLYGQDACDKVFRKNALRIYRLNSPALLLPELL